MLHIFSKFKRTRGKRKQDSMHYFSRGFYSTVRKTSKCGQKSYFLWKLHCNFPVYICAVLDLAAARRNLKKQLSQNLSSKLLFALQPAWIDVLAGCLFSFPEDSTTAFQGMALDFFCLPGICFLVLSDSSTNPAGKQLPRHGKPQPNQTGNNLAWANCRRAGGFTPKWTRLLRDTPTDKQGR